MNGKENLVFEDRCFWIKNDDDTRDSVVMHESEGPLMHRLAEIVTKNGGDILEMGFGLGCSATAIQNNPKVTSHTIIEIHPEVYKKALIWAENRKNTKIILGDWRDIIPTLNIKYNGILHDTHNERWDDFLNCLKPLCAENCILGFFEYFDSNFSKDYENFNIESFQLSEKDFQDLPYENEIIEAWWKNKKFDLQWITYKDGDFIKKIDGVGLLWVKKFGGHWDVVEHE
jgi:cyclopropane fatty-acyl-phospholipid synthase-like methyltransferase